MNGKVKLAIYAASLVFILEALALWTGMDGVALSAAIAAIAGLGGWTIGKTVK